MEYMFVGVVVRGKLRNDQSIIMYYFNTTIIQSMVHLAISIERGMILSLLLVNVGKKPAKEEMRNRR